MSIKMSIFPDFPQPPTMSSTFDANADDSMAGEGVNTGRVETHTVHSNVSRVYKRRIGRFPSGWTAVWAMAGVCFLRKRGDCWSKNEDDQPNQARVQRAELVGRRQQFRP